MINLSSSSCSIPASSARTLFKCHEKIRHGEEFGETEFKVKFSKPDPGFFESDTVMLTFFIRSTAADKLLAKNENVFPARFKCQKMDKSYNQGLFYRWIMKVMTAKEG